jgi:hypothetical protein
VSRANASLPLRLVEQALSNMAERTVTEGVAADARAKDRDHTASDESGFVVLPDKSGSFDLTSTPQECFPVFDPSTLTLEDFDLVVDGSGARTDIEQID